MIFTISDEKFFDKNYIKVIDGIAGAGKSSIIDKFFEDNGKKYGRYTSTNVLKRDAEKRYPGTHIETIASGLFVNNAENRTFYKEPKDIEFEDIVIDEILQTSVRVIDYCKAMVGKKNIIITTDTMQMLAPECGENLIQKFMDLKKDSNVIWVTLKESKRPVNSETNDLYQFCYKNVENNKVSIFSTLKAKGKIKFGRYEDYKITSKDVVMTHTNNIEDFLYKSLNPRESGFELIPKGTIARKQPKNLECYPVTSQKDAESKNIKAYLQAKNLCTPTRYQGSEVQPGQHCYFIIEEKSRITNREIYTVLTRCKDINDLTVLTITLPDNGEIKFFNGKPVKHHGYLTIDHETPELEKGLQRGYLRQDEIEKVLKGKKDPKTSYDQDCIIYKGTPLMTRECKIIEAKRKNSKDYSPSSLAKKDERMHYSYTAELYRILERNGLDRIQYPILHGPREPKENFRYELDLYSAYPHIFAQEKMPVDGFISYEQGNPENIDFYLYTGPDGELINGTIFSDALEEYIPQGKYLFSVPSQKGMKAGIFLYDQAHRSIESKAKLKEFHWGYYQKKYLQPIFDENGEIECYEMNENFIYEILMIVILSNLTHIILNLKSLFPESMAIVDAIFFDKNTFCFENWETYDHDHTRSQMAIDLMKEKFPGYHFRIKDYSEFDAKEDFILSSIEYIYFRTYETLKSEKELRKEAKRLSEQKARQEGRRTDTRKNHHKKVS